MNILDWIEINQIELILATVLVIWLGSTMYVSNVLKKLKNREIQPFVSLALYTLEKTKMIILTESDVMVYRWLCKEADGHSDHYGNKADALVKNIRKARKKLYKVYLKVVHLPYDQENIDELLAEVSYLALLMRINFIEEHKDSSTLINI